MSLIGKILCLFYAALYYLMMTFIVLSVAAMIHANGWRAFDAHGVFLTLIIILAMAAMTKGYFDYFAPDLKIVEVRRVQDRKLRKEWYGKR